MMLIGASPPIYPDILDFAVTAVACVFALIGLLAIGFAEPQEEQQEEHEHNS